MDSMLNPHQTPRSSLSEPMPRCAARLHGKPRGFTLLELMIAVAIIAVMSVFVVPSVLDNLEKAKVTQARADIETLSAALKMYKASTGRYPTAEQGLQALISRPTVGPIPQGWSRQLDKLPNDPWKRPYQYASPGIKGDVDVFSFGANGESGGEGFDADIGSWE